MKILLDRASRKNCGCCSRVDTIITTWFQGYQQNLTARNLAILVLSTNNWSEIKAHVGEITAAINAATPGAYVEVDIALGKVPSVSRGQAAPDGTGGGVSQLLALNGYVARRMADFHIVIDSSNGAPIFPFVVRDSSHNHYKYILESVHQTSSRHSGACILGSDIRQAQVDNWASFRLILWHSGAKGTATLAFLWPLVVLVLPYGSGRIGEIQKMFMQCLGYQPPK
jgi:hypothetical protein